MNTIKLFTNVHETQTFQGFTLQKGFIYGFIDRMPVVTNGTLFFRNGHRLLKMHRPNKYNEWQSVIVTDENPLFDHFYKLIKKNVLKGNKKSYADAIELEDMRLRELRANGVEPSPMKARASKPYDTKYNDCEWRVKQACGKETYMGLGDGLIKMKYQPEIIL